MTDEEMTCGTCEQEIVVSLTRQSIGGVELTYWWCARCGSWAGKFSDNDAPVKWTAPSHFDINKFRKETE